MAPPHLHASAVAWEGRALLFSGPSGAGKSAMTLELMALGCSLVADDTVILSAKGGRLCAAAAPATRGLIEARGLGLLHAWPEDGPVPVVAEVDLSKQETDRLPQAREIERLGVRLPLLFRPAGAHAAAALLQFLKAGRQTP